MSLSEKGGFQVGERTRSVHENFKRSTHLFTTSNGLLRFIFSVGGRASWFQEWGSESPMNVGSFIVSIHCMNTLGAHLLEVGTYFQH